MSFLSRRNSRKDSLLEISEEDMAKISANMGSVRIAEAIHEAEAGEGLLASFTNFEDYLFDVLSEGKNTVYLSRFIWGLQTIGLHKGDFRLKECMKRLKQAQSTLAAKGKDCGLDRETFKQCINPNVVLIKRAFDADFVIPDFSSFRTRMDSIFNECQEIRDGKVASYIPQLARVDPDKWGVSICTVDGQRYDNGCSDTPFTLADTHHPLSYALCLNELSWEVVEKYIGEEPSGFTSNSIRLDCSNRPHNPMINSGAIVAASLLKNDYRMADRFDYVSQQYKKLAGGEFLGFNNSVYLSERESSDRNFALGYYMQENKCFPSNAKLEETLDFYFQMCSVEVTCESASAIAATLANGGLCPMTGEQVLTGEAVRNTLSLMHSCGMYDYSGQFAFNVGLPAKSGVSGCIMVVIPNVMGICLWSPPLDQYGNSKRGIRFCEKLVETFNFHQYDNLLHADQKNDPRRRATEKNTESDFYLLLFGAYMGDLSTLKRLYLSGIDMSSADYDGRTALHVCASEGHLECVRFLLKVCGVPHTPKDRWDHTPLSEATEVEHTEVKEFLEEFIAAHPNQ